MLSHCSDHVVVALLRRCFLNPRCHRLPKSYSHLQQRSTSNLPNRIRLRPSNSCCQQQLGSFRTHVRSGHRTTHVPVGFADQLQPRFSWVSQQSRNASSHSGQGEIAILGGGITGLASAHYLTQQLPNARITLYEASGQLGGWLQSKRVETEKGTVLFEGGPRTLRSSTPAGMVVLELISQLNLKGELLMTPKDSVAARNRFVYYPDHLVRMPGPGQDFYSLAWGLLTEPIFKGLLSGALWESTRPPRSPSLEDESVGSFLERRLGSPHPGNNIVSAVLHGIYAGDLYQLSAKSLMPKLWYMDGSESVTSAMLSSLRQRSVWIPQRDVILLEQMKETINPEYLENMKSASVYTFKEGIGALSSALEASLRSNSKVRFNLGEQVSHIKYDEHNDKVKITGSKNQPPTSFSNVVSTISGQRLSSLTNAPIPSLAETHAVTVMVVNLFYADPNILPERGFGYLIPRSIPFDQNPECALGVVFDSDSSAGQDTVSGTKITVMIGGHWWDGFDSYPNDEEGASLAKAVILRHLGVVEDPLAVRVTLQKDCIPQYTVGHDERMKSAHSELFSQFRGKLSVAGNSYGGVGLNDCVRGARDVTMALKDGHRVTGLEQFVRPTAWSQLQVPSSQVGTG